MDSSFRDWARLPVHILDLVVAKFGPLSDYVRYCAVCTQWRDSALVTDVRHRQYMDILKKSQKKLPMLMITTSDEKMRGLYSVSDRITYNVELPVDYKNRFIGSSHGWLICIEKNLIITLLNPFTNRCISLPPLGDFNQVYEHEYSSHIWESYVQKVILTADPLKEPNSYAVLVIYTGMRNLAVFKSSNRSWDYNALPPSYFNVLSDIVFYRGYVYGVTRLYKLLQLDINTGIYTTIVDKRANSNADNFYLVESQEGDLLLVKRIWDRLAYSEGQVEANGPNKTFEVKVFKLEIGLTKRRKKKKRGSWVEIDNIGDQILFVGGNCSISISSTEFSDYKSTSVYFTDVRHEKYPPYSCQGVDEDNGIYTIEDQQFHSLLDQVVCTQPSIWFVPNP